MDVFGVKYILKLQGKRRTWGRLDTVMEEHPFPNALQA